MLIAGAIGGTNYDALDMMVREFLRATGWTAQAACLDVADPVIADRAHPCTSAPRRLPGLERHATAWLGSPAVQSPARRTIHLEARR